MFRPRSRRGLLVGAGTVGLGIAAGVSRGEDRPNAGGPDSAFLDWPMERFDAPGTGYNPNASGPKRGATIRWKRRIRSDPGAPPSPIVFGGRVYAVGDYLFSFDARTGDLAFRTDDVRAYRSAPAAAPARAYRNRTVVVADRGGLVGLNADGGFRLLGRRVGLRRWRTGANDPLPHVFYPSGPHAAPVFDGQRTYASIPGAEALAAVDSSSGRELWRTPIEGEITRPAVLDGVVYVGGSEGVFALDATTGERLWHRNVGEDEVFGPTVDERTVFVPHERGVTALSRDDGARRWEFPAGEFVRSGIALAGDRLLCIDSARDPRVHALDPKTGDVVWQAPGGSEYASPVVADGVAYVPTKHGSVVAYDADDGTERWRVALDESFWVSTPAVSGGRVFVGTDSHLYALAEAGR